MFFSFVILPPPEVSDPGAYLGWMIINFFLWYYILNGIVNFSTMKRKK